MVLIYKGNDNPNTVNQNNNWDYDEIYTYGGGDTINLTLRATYVDAGTGTDTVRSNAEGNNDIFLGWGNDTYVGTGFSTNTNVFDIVHANQGNDKITVWTNVSEYYGDSGNDTISSAGYRNYLHGGSGIDTVSYQAQDTDSALRGKGVSVDLSNQWATTGSDRVEDVVNFENAIGTSYKDTLRGTSGNNMLNGASGNDLIDGRGGNDRLFGGAGSDDVYGGGGNDTIDGGLGQDYLTGDSGADMFVFASIKDTPVGAGRDIVADFFRSEGDGIDLSKIDAIQGGGDDAFHFVGSGNLQAAGDLQFKNGIVAGDVDGDGFADFQIRVSNMSKMFGTDFDL